MIVVGRVSRRILTLLLIKLVSVDGHHHGVFVLLFGESQE